MDSQLRSLGGVWIWASSCHLSPHACLPFFCQAAGYTLQTLKAAGYKEADFKAAGYVQGSPRAGGGWKFDPLQKLDESTPEEEDQGSALRGLRAGGYTAEDAKEAGWT